MKTALVAAMACLLLAACDEKPTNTAPKSSATKPPTSAPTGSTPAKAPDALDLAKKAAGDSGATTQLRDQAVAAFSAKYDEFKMQIATLQDKAKEVPAAAKATFDSAMTQLNTLTKDVEAKLVELKNATGEAIKKAHDSIDSAWPKIQEQVTAAEKALKGG